MTTGPIAVRDHVIDTLRKELVGPDPGRPAVQWHGAGSPLNGEEMLRSQDRPRMRYGAGILFPNGMTYSGLVDTSKDIPDSADTDIATTADESEEEGDEDEADEDSDVSSLNSFVPSSMGISFLADTRDGLTIRCAWATYAPIEWEQKGGLRAGIESFWARTPHSAEVIVPPTTSQNVVQSKKVLEDGVGPACVVVDRPWAGSLRLVTVTMINERPSGATIRDEDCFFQCQVRVAPTGSSRVCPYPSRPDADLDEEERSLKLLYRHKAVFAVGHGCAADWSIISGNASEVRTETLPVFTQPPILPRNALDGVNLSMLGLSTAESDDLLVSCHKLGDAYEGWIKSRHQELDGLGLSQMLRETAEKHLDGCSESLGRIRGGIDLLQADARAMTAFRWMNLAMLQQRAHYALSSDKEKRRKWVEVGGEAAPERPYSTPPYQGGVAWRPFQLAFILMNLKSLADPSSEERSLVDVIWFPTGGGKTEAYLGLAAWVMLYRRLNNRSDTGTSVLMRYTLRLLTAQQFQRASSLICALELLRRANTGRLGGEPYTIGLWLGSGVTPNREQQALDQLAELNDDDGQNHFVVLSCPWCGVEMGRRPYGDSWRVFGYEKVREPNNTVKFMCRDPSCPFNDANGLPLEVIDERIYRRPPTLVIGTVDKFAMLPWIPEGRKLFGYDYANASPPDLIIQDELHLISGPLGSMVGHYETLIDELCSRVEDGRRISPKIVASTATISYAAEQVRALYGREARLFPAQALTAGDSFFAQERPEVEGRTYVGVLGSGLSSHVVAQIRVTAALLQAPASMQNIADVADIDPYWSLITYFNSLRELGRASTLIQADIREYLNWIWQRSGISDDRSIGIDRRRFINHDVELTSRVPSSQVPEILERLFTGLPDRSAVDVCFATNMIQVGLDVPRLSLMMIVGQPKGASEYIQASSRVGRELSKPGLVIANYNPFKPRDRSHFETFRQYHESIYRYVEPTSVTPFSLPVCERAIHALAIAFIRCLYPSMREKPGQGAPPQLQKAVRDVIQKRIAAVGGDAQQLRRAEMVLDDFFQNWARKSPAIYGTLSEFMKGDRPLMIQAGRVWGDGEDPIPRSTPTSMRNVDAESQAWVLSQYGTGGD